MEITITKSREFPSVIIMHLDGKLDGSNYESLTAAAQELYVAGGRDLILDLSKLNYISSAGIAALHKVALLFRGEKYPERDEGWAAYRAIDRDRDRGVQEHVKLLGPSEQVRHVLDLTGFNALFEIHTQLKQAAISFRQSAPTMQTRLP